MKDFAFPPDKYGHTPPEGLFLCQDLLQTANPEFCTSAWGLD